MLSVMPMEPTRPMPKRSSGTKAMATPAFLICMGVLPTSSEAGLPLRGEPDGALGHGVQARNGLQQLPSGPSRRCRRCPESHRPKR